MRASAIASFRGGLMAGPKLNPHERPVTTNLGRRNGVVIAERTAAPAPREAWPAGRFGKKSPTLSA